MTKAKTPAEKAAATKAAKVAAAAEKQETSNASLQPGPDATAVAASTTQPPADGAADTKAKNTPKVKGVPGAKILRQVVVEKMNFGTLQMDKHHEVREDDADVLPESLKVFAMYGYLEEDGQSKFWAAGCVVTDPDEMRELIARGVVFEE